MAANEHDSQPDLTAGVRTGLTRDLGSGSASKNLARYYNNYPTGSKDGFTGRWFDEWCNTDRPNEFTSVDFYAVTALWVEIPPRAGETILANDRMPILLKRLPNDKDIWEVGSDVVSSMNALNVELQKIHRIGPTTASKLMAAKRPRLVPIYDSVVEERLSPPKGGFWQAMHYLLQDETLRSQAESVRSEALASCNSATLVSLSLLRVIDVVVWMAGRRGLAA